MKTALREHVLHVHLSVRMCASLLAKSGQTHTVTACVEASIRRIRRMSSQEKPLQHSGSESLKADMCLHAGDKASMQL